MSSEPIYRGSTLIGQAAHATSTLLAGSSGLHPEVWRRWFNVIQGEMAGVMHQDAHAYRNWVANLPPPGYEGPPHDELAPEPEDPPVETVEWMPVSKFDGSPFA